MGVSEKLQEMDGGAEIERRIPMKPILTKSMERRSRYDGGEEEGDEDGCNSTTPTCAKSRIPTRLPCPPPPKKRKAAASWCHYGGAREFFCPPSDLEAIFIRRVEGA